jgi:hypothetical protein
VIDVPSPIIQLRDVEAGAPIIRLPREAAVEAWEARQILPRELFDKLSGAMKKRAFTFAGTAKKDMLDTVHAELTKRLKSGTLDLREFKKFAKERMESAGWTPSSPTHVETIFRTNVASAMAAGRVADQTQPAVMAALPFWQIIGVRKRTEQREARQRLTHWKASGIVLPANHEFWQKAYPPFGYSCRCRVVSRTAGYIRRNNLAIGPVPVGLPDPGFTSGIRGLVPVGADIGKAESKRVAAESKRNTEQLKEDTSLEMREAEAQTRVVVLSRPEWHCFIAQDEAVRVGRLADCRPNHLEHPGPVEPAVAAAWQSESNAAVAPNLHKLLEPPLNELVAGELVP